MARSAVVSPACAPRVEVGRVGLTAQQPSARARHAAFEPVTGSSRLCSRFHERLEAVSRKRFAGNKPGLLRPQRYCGIHGSQVSVKRSARYTNRTLIAVCLVSVLEWKNSTKRITCRPDRGFRQRRAGSRTMA